MRPGGSFLGNTDAFIAFILQGKLCNIFTLDSEKLSLFNVLTVESWRRHVHGTFASSSELCNIVGSKRQALAALLAPLLAAEVVSHRLSSLKKCSGLCNEPVLINDHNVRIYVPDLPEEYFKLPYPSAKSDMIRYALLYHHGGIYMDPDMLVRDLVILC